MPTRSPRARRPRSHRARAPGGAERGRGEALRAARALADAAAAVGLIPHCAALAAAARSIGVPVFHCTAETRDDLKGANRNARLFLGVRKSPVPLSPGSEAVQVPEPIGVDPGDVVLPRHHGLGPDDRDAARLHAAQPGRHDDRGRRRLTEHRHDQLRVRRGEPRLPIRDADGRGGRRSGRVRRSSGREHAGARRHPDDDRSRARRLGLTNGGAGSLDPVSDVATQTLRARAAAPFRTFVATPERERDRPARARPSPRSCGRTRRGARATKSSGTRSCRSPLGDHELSLDLLHWVNDGLMTFFFFVVGLEIRREFDMGELRERRRLATPVVAAIGGMVVPALIYLAFNAGDPGAKGWGIVMGTDTAFALGVLALVGRRLPAPASACSC